MSKDKPLIPKAVVASAVAVGIAAGSYGIASAATDSGSSSSSSSSGTVQPAAASPSAPGGQAPRNGPGGQRSDETLLTGDTASKVKAAALAKVPNGTIVRVETDADGNAAFEAHMTRADGTPVTVFVDEEFNVVSVERR